MTSTSRAYFESMYENSPDPWHFASSEYEQRKYALTVASLPRKRYRNAFEPGCSIGVLSELLAARCDRLLSTDIISNALATAAERLTPLGNVRVEVCSIPHQWPQEMFDLMVLSEVAYYFDVAELRRLVQLIGETTQPGAHVVGVHWRGETDYPQSADEVHDQINDHQFLRRIVQHSEPDFRLDVWERVE
jgi:cyclopropane fatty-acyl-phospholipid synthase-like methyltransferase